MDNFTIFNHIDLNLKNNIDKQINNPIHYELARLLGNNIHLCKDFHIAILFFFSSGDVKLNNHTIKVFEGNLLIVKYCTNISINLNDFSNLAYVLYMDEEFLDSYFVSQMTDCPIFYDFLRLQSKEMEYLFFDCSSKNTISLYVNTLLLEASLQNYKDNKLMKCALILFLSNLHIIHTSNLVISESTMMENYDIGRFLKYMTNNYSTVTLTSMAKYFNFHPAYFSLLFKQLAGSTFSEKLLLIKLEQSKRLLVTTNLTIQHIIELIGFHEKSHFYKCFKKHFNMTPGEYRKAYKHV